ncbi:hypothetical protein [Janthinobacterium sp. BJB304]|uniref:hypothetical protein n=1 Tax=Janthinobacterium sp. BJB304 TaxID=1572871 RepID=UPI00211F1AA5|nr:hypothetical protein [Janthinobacterium sp. BJB304]
MRLAIIFAHRDAVRFRIIDHDSQLERIQSWRHGWRIGMGNAGSQCQQKEERVMQGQFRH